MDAADIGGSVGMPYRIVQAGIWPGVYSFPTTRRIYGWEGEYQLVPEPLLVAIDMGELTIR